MSWSILDRYGSGQFEKREPHGPGPGLAPPESRGWGTSHLVWKSQLVAVSPSLAVCGRITATAFFARFPNVDYSAHRKCLDVVISLKDARLAVAWTFWPPPSFDNVDLVCMRGIQRKSAAVGNGGQQFYPYF